MLGSRKSFSPIGVVFPTLAFYLYFGNLPITYIAVMGVIGAIINLIPTTSMEYNKKSSIKEKFSLTKENLTKEVENAMLILQRIKDNNISFDELNTAISYSKNNLANIYDNIDKCKNMECLNELVKNFNDTKNEIETSVNEIIFNNIVSYNEVISKLKKYGINGEEIQIANDKFYLNESGLDYIFRISFNINKNTNILLSDLNGTIDNLEKLIGMKLNKIFITDFKKLLNLVTFIQDNNLIVKLRNLVEIEKEIITKLDDPKLNETKLEISKKLNLINLSNITLYEIKQIIQISKELDNMLDSEISNINKNLNDFNLEIGKDLNQQQKLVYSRLMSEKTLYDKFSNFLSSINIINDCIDIINNKIEIESLYQMLDSNYKELLSMIYESKCINISDLGINPRFSKYVTYWLHKNGIKAIYIKDKICLS
jgi:hypothetical protein